MTTYEHAMPTLLFAGGMFAMLRWPSRFQTVGWLTLASVTGYIVLRGTLTH